jgi:hypothetical protein
MGHLLFQSTIFRETPGKTIVISENNDIKRQKKLFIQTTGQIGLDLINLCQNSSAIDPVEHLLFDFT